MRSSRELSCYRSKSCYPSTKELFCRECRSFCARQQKPGALTVVAPRGQTRWLFRDDGENFTGGYSWAGDYLTIAISRTEFVSIERRNKFDKIYLSWVYSLSDLIKRGVRLPNFDFDNAIWDPLNDLNFFLWHTRLESSAVFFTVSLWFPVFGRKYSRSVSRMTRKHFPLRGSSLKIF